MSKKILAALIVAIATATACVNDENLGADIMPATDQPTLTVTDTIPIKAYTLADDSVYTAYQASLLVGRYVDPIFGKTDAAFCAKFSNTSYGKFLDQAICDSVVLTMALDSTITHFYGNLKDSTKINIYTLNQAIDPEAEYYNNYDYTQIIDSKPLTTIEFVPNDTLTQIKCLLPIEYGNKIMQSTKDTTFDANIPGLCFAPDPTSECVVKTQQTYNGVQYSVYYHVVGDTTNYSVVYSISNIDPRFSTFLHDYSDTKVFDTTDNNYLYLQCMCGTKIQFDFSAVKQLNNLQYKYFALQRAQLIVPIANAEASIETDYPPISDIVCVGINRTTKSLVYFSEHMYTNYYGETLLQSIKLNSTNRYYSINLTTRIDDLLKKYQAGDEPLYDICIFPNARTTDFSRTLINSTNNTDNPIKLVVQYTVFDK